jgi:hypothetical protein
MRVLSFAALCFACATVPIVDENSQPAARLAPVSAPVSAPVVKKAPSGPCLEEFDFDVDGVMDGQTSYQYNAKGQLEREDFLSLGHGALPHTNLHKYDAAGNLIDTTMIINEKPYVRWAKQYDGLKLIKEETIQIVADCAKGPVIDRQFKTAYLPGNDPKGPMRAEENVFEYDLCNAGDGWVHQRTSYLYKDRVSTPYQKKYEEPTYRANPDYNIELSYDAEGRLSEELYTTSYTPKGYAKIKHSYDQSKETIDYDWTLDGVFEERTVKTFDKDSKILQEDRYEGSKLRWSMVTTYNALGQKIKEEVDGSGSNVVDGKIDHQSFYTYECKNSPAAKSN